MNRGFLKSAVRLGLNLAMAAGLLRSAAAQTAPTSTDTIFMTSGERRTGRVLGFDGQAFKMEVMLVAGQPPATVQVPRANVSQIEFAPDETRDSLIAKATVADLSRVGELWKRWEPFLAVPRSPSVALGVRYGLLLVESGDAAKIAEAETLFGKIEKNAWSEEGRMGAKQGRLRVMIATGHSQEAVAQAAELVSTATDPEVIIEARFLLGRVADEALRKLVEENPRWEEDERVRPERNRLYHEAVDQYLYPYLAFGSRADLVTRGLWRLVELYRFVGEQQLALETARDLVALYPSTPAGQQASTWIASLPPEAKAEDFELEARKAVDPLLGGAQPTSRPAAKKDHEKK